MMAPKRKRRGERLSYRGLTPEQQSTVLLLARAVGDHVREHRIKLGLTQPQLAQRYGVCGERINHIECVKKPNLSLGTAIRMLDDIGYTLAVVKKEPQP